MDHHPLILGIDGGGTQCRARLCAASGAVLGTGRGGPANVRLDLEQGFAAALDAAQQCCRQAGLVPGDLSRVTACLAFAGASEPESLAAARQRGHPFAHAIITSDGHAACIGAHRGGDGGVIAVGTGLIGWAVVSGRHHRVGGWGFPVSDEGSGAWLGCEAVRRVLWAHDGRIGWTPLLGALFDRFGSDPHALVRWMSAAQPRDFASLAPQVVEHAGRGDRQGAELMRGAASHVDAAAGRLIEINVPRLSILGGLADALEPWLAQQTKRRLQPALGDALDGAVRLARGALPATAAAG